MLYLSSVAARLSASVLLVLLFTRYEPEPVKLISARSACPLVTADCTAEQL